jgi:small-conductance mechanosensitive channel
MYPHPTSFLLATLALLAGPAVHGFVTPSITVPLSATRSLSKLPTTTTAPFSSTTQSILSSLTSTSTSTSLSAVAKKAAAVAASRRTPGSSVLRGKLSAVVGKFLISPQRAAQVFLAIGQHVIDDVGDLALILMLLKAPFPLAKYIYRKRHATKEWSDDMLAKQFAASKTRRVARLILEIGELLGIIWATEVGILLLKELGFQFVRLYPINQWMAGIVFSLWGARNASAAKYFLLSRGNKIDLSKSGGPRLLNRFFDVLIYAGTALAILDFLSVETGLALRSLFGLSSIGTLVFSLASKELVAEFLASLAIQGTNMYQEGDDILLQDGTQGTVQKLGWLNTHVRRGDELVVRIPNSQISGTRTANVSRVRLSQVKQTLAIRYEDLNKLPQLALDIKEEIRLACGPTLIDDGFRSFRVHWREYKNYYLEVVVDAHFRVKPFCDAYFETREQVLQAIARATEKNGVLFSYTNFLNAGVPVSGFDDFGK